MTLWGAIDCGEDDTRRAPAAMASAYIAHQSGLHEHQEEWECAADRLFHHYSFAEWQRLARIEKDVADMKLAIAGLKEKIVSEVVDAVVRQIAGTRVSRKSDGITLQSILDEIGSHSGNEPNFSDVDPERLQMFFTREDDVAE